MREGGREGGRDSLCPIPSHTSSHTLSTWISIMKAFLLQEASCSPSRYECISSGASGMRWSKFLRGVLWGHVTLIVCDYSMRFAVCISPGTT